VSAAGRGPALGGAEEVYETPSWAVRRLLEAWRPRPGIWLEPCAATGKIIAAVDDALHADGDWRAVELRNTARELADVLDPHHVRIADFLHADFDEYFRADLEQVTAIVTNPPFSLAGAFLSRCFDLCPNADVVMLLRAAWYEEEDRSEFLAECCPDFFGLPNRPPFRNGKTDMAAYGWFHFPAHAPIRRVGDYRILKRTPLSERKRG
jgi:hypothetical protein